MKQNQMKLNDLVSKLKAAQHPEDIFGNDLEGKFRELAKALHPDLHKGKAAAKLAEEGFKELGKWHMIAKEKVKKGAWGDPTWMSPITLSTKKSTYILTRRIISGDVANVYVGTSTTDSIASSPCAIKVCRSPANNDLLNNEQEILSYLWNDAKTKGVKAMTHIVKFRESMEMAAGPARKRVNVCHLAHGYYTLAEVKLAYPGGIDVRDGAWMFNRLLGALLVMQQAGVVHNAVLPDHILVHPEKHNAKLCGWSYATKGKVPAKAYVLRRMAFYAPELLDRKPTTTATDIFMAATSVMSVIDPKTMPRNVAGIFKACLLAQRARPQDSWALFKEFGKELEAAFGPKKFRPFVMPTASNARP
jgi:hypothetical protein